MLLLLLLLRCYNMLLRCHIMLLLLLLLLRCYNMLLRCHFMLLLLLLWWCYVIFK